MWSFLQPEEEHLAMNIGCNRMSTVAWDLYSRCGWRCDRRLACWCPNVYLFSVV
jgi:hypothetical protein